jgi:hypothetical protein
MIESTAGLDSWPNGRRLADVSAASYRMNAEPGVAGSMSGTYLVPSTSLPAARLVAAPAAAPFTQPLAPALGSGSSEVLVTAPATVSNPMTPAAQAVGGSAAPQVPILSKNISPPPATEAPALQAQAAHTLAGLSTGFEANQGQYRDQVRFMGRAEDYTLFLTPGEVVIGLRQPSKADYTVPGETGGYKTAGVGQALTADPPAAGRTALVHMQLVGSNLDAPVVGQHALPGKVNYYFGNDPSRWFTGIPTFGQVRYQGVYSGIDLVFYGTANNTVEYDFDVAAGAHPETVNLGFAGAGLSLDGQGNLVLSTEIGQLVQHKPNAYQVVNGVRHEVAAAFAVNSHNQVSFQLGAYDSDQPLVIDPGVQFSTYLGGSGIDRIFGVGVDGAGNVYVDGHTQSIDFPTTAGAFQPSYPQGAIYNAFVAKLDPTGDTLLYSTYIGGTTNDQASSIAVDLAGDAVAVGFTKSPDFPTTPDAFQRLLGGPRATNEFVAKFDPTGALIASTYLGGRVDEEGFNALPGPGVALDASGNIYVGGYSASPDFPVTASAYQSHLMTGAARNAFLSKLSPDASALLYSTYLGGSHNVFGRAASDGGSGVGVVGNIAFLCGITTAMDFPTTPGAFQTSGQGGGTPAQPDYHVFVAKIDTRLSGSGSLLYSTYLGGSADDESNAIAVDAAGDAFLTGDSNSPDFPVTPGAFQTTYEKANTGSYDAFVTELSPDGSRLIFSSYYGGTVDDDEFGDVGNAIALDGSGNVYLAGSTGSSDLPVTPNAFQMAYHGGRDAFACQISPDGSTLLYGTYFGGGAIDAGLAITTYQDANGNMVVYTAGSTGSSDLPVSRGALQTRYGGGLRDGWLVGY